MKELEATVELEPEAQNGHSNTAELEGRIQELTVAHTEKEQVHFLIHYYNPLYMLLPLVQNMMTMFITEFVCLIGV